MKIEELLLGRADFEVAPRAAVSAANLLLTAGMTVNVKNSGKFTVSLTQIGRVKQTLAGKIPYRITAKRGLIFRVLSFSHRIGLLAACAVFFALSLLAADLVLAVEVEEGCDLDAEEVRAAFSAAGLSEGKFWHKIDRDAVTSRVLREAEGIGWAHINREGAVARLSVAKNAAPVPDPTAPPSNLVASRDAVIEEISVLSGKCVVKPGDAVRKGDLLISGVTSDRDTPFVAAEGRIFAREERTFSLTVPFSDTEYAPDTCVRGRVALEFFGKSIKIFQRYGNPPEGCAIIEKKTPLSAPRGTDLPFSVTVTEYVTERAVAVTRTPAEACALAISRLADDVREAIGDSDLVSVSFDGYYTDTGYTATCRAVVLSDIAQAKIIEISD